MLPDQLEDAHKHETMQRGILRDVKIDKLLKIINALSIISLNSQLIEKLYQNDAKVSEKTGHINNIASRVSMLITEIVNGAHKQ